MADPDRSALDEARKRARRRLVGAVVLALAIAVVLPMFLETEPKPLGPDVQIQIPPIDDGKFQNRLTPEPKSPKAADAPKMQAAPSLPPDTSSKSSAPAVASPSAAAGTPVEIAKQDAARPAASSASEPAKKPETAGAPAPAATVSTSPPAQTPASTAVPLAQSAAAPPSSSPASSPAQARSPNPKSGAFVVQLGAFVGVPIAAELADKARAQGFPVFLEQVTTKGGQVHRVRVGPYATREDAQADAVKLKLAGFTADVRPR